MKFGFLEKHLKLLLIENDFSEASFLIRCLGLPAHNIEVCASVLAGIETIEESEVEFNLILLDLNVGTKDGISTFVKLHERFPRTPIIVLTNNTNLWQVKEQLISSGAQECLFKDEISPASLRRVVKSSLDRYKKLNQQMDLKDVIKKQMDSKMRFLANFSHEIRTPLNTIIGNLSLLEDKKLDAESEDILTNIKIGCDRLLRSVNDVLDLSKMNANNFKLLFHETTSKDIFSDIVSMFSAGAQSKGLYLSSMIAPNIPEVLSTDSHRLKQIIANYISNSIKYTSQGRVELNVSLGESEDQLLIEVCDTGRGLSEHSLKNLFESFAQDQESDAFNGTGLGLSICKLLAKLFGGDVWAYNNPKRGASFWLTIPLKRVGRKTIMSGESDTKLALISLEQFESTRILDQLKPIYTNIEHIILESESSTIGLEAASSAEIVFLDDFYWDKKRSEILTGKLAGLGVKKLMSFQMPQSNDNGLTMKQPSGCQLTLLGQIDSMLRVKELKTGPKQTTKVLPATKKMKNGNLKRVLICDDDETNRRLVQRILAKDDIQCLQAENGQMALDMVIQNPSFDLILMDCNMPVMDGFEACKKINQLSPHIPAVAMTGLNLEQEEEKLRDLGMRDCLEKPILKNQLQHLVAKILC